MLFNNIIGHHEVTKSLESSLLSGKVGHAFLFVGPEHVGKDTLAKRFAEKLLCRGDFSDIKCDCESCNRYTLENHPDFITIAPTGNSIKIDQLRELQRKAYFSPVVGKRKIFYFPDAEKLTDVAANSFLKLLEEAPSGIVFLFTAIRSDHILPTIRSRCQVYTMFPVPTPELEIQLVNKGITSPEAERLAKESKGLPGLAFGLNNDSPETIVIPWDQIISCNLLQLFKTAEELEKKDRKEVLLNLREWEKQLRQRLLQIHDQASGTSQNSVCIINILEKLAQVIIMCESNVHQRLLLEEFFISVKQIT